MAAKDDEAKEDEMADTVILGCLITVGLWFVAILVIPPLFVIIEKYWEWVYERWR